MSGTPEVDERAEGPQPTAEDRRPTALRKRSILLRTVFFALAAITLLTVCRSGQPLLAVGTVFTIYVAAAALWVRGQYATSVDPYLTMWTPPWQISAALAIDFGVVVLGVGGLVMHSGTALIGGAMGVFFAVGYLIMFLRDRRSRTSLVVWGIWLGVCVAAMALGLVFISSTVGLILLGAGFVLAPPAISVLSAGLIDLLCTRTPSERAVLAAGSVGLVVAGAGVSLYRVQSPWMLVACVVLVLLIAALVSNTYADIAAVIAIVALLGVTPAQAEKLREPAKGEEVLVALGDSYMSGEGAKVFYPGSDEGRDNQCHRAPTSWAAMAGQSPPFDGLVFLACSGALSYNVRAATPGGMPGEGEPETRVQWNEPGTQLNQYATRDDARFKPSLVVVSLGGNDAGFASIGAMCLAPGDCDQEGERLWQNNLPNVRAELSETYRQVRTVFKDVPVAVVGYPAPIFDPENDKDVENDDVPVDCSNVALSIADRRFVKSFLADLNSTVKAAAGAHGFYYVDEMEDALADAHLQLCDPRNEGRPGLNFIGLRSVNGVAEQRFNPQNWYHNSFHPNVSGHAAMLRTFEVWWNEDTWRAAEDPESSLARGTVEADEEAADAGPGGTGRGDPGCALYAEEGELPECEAAAGEWAAGQVRDLLFGLWGLILLVIAVGSCLAAASFYAWRIGLSKKRAGQDAGWLDSLLGTW